MYTVIFIDTRGPATLGRYEDKGACRRAWRHCNHGAAILGADGALLECKSGTGDAAERKLKAYAEHLKRQGKLPAPPAEEPAPPRAVARAASVEAEAEEEDDEPEEATDADEEPEEDEPTTYTRVDTIEQVDAMVARDDARAAAREQGAVPAPDPDDNALGMDTARHRFAAAAEAFGPEDFRGEDYPAEGPQPIACPPRYVGGKCEDCGAPVPFPSDTCGPCDQRRQTPADPPPVADAPAIAAPRGAAPVTCATKGCDRAPGIARSNVRLTWCPFCGPCRVIIRQRGRAFPGGEDAVMEHLRAGTLPPVDPHRSAYSARGGKASRGVPKAAPKPAPTPAPAPKPRRPTSPAATLAAGLETARACAEVVARLGGLGPARELAAIVEEHGGAEAVLVTLAAVAELGGMAA